MLVPMTLSDPNPGFKVTVYIQVEYLLGTKLLWYTNSKPYQTYLTVPCLVFGDLDYNL